MPRQAPLPKRTNIGVRRAQKCAKPCKMCTTQKAKTFLDAQASSTYKTHRNWSAKSPKMCTKKILVWMDAQASSTSKTHRTWSVKSTKMCKTMQNVHNSKSKNFFGCPGKLHLQNAQKLECKKPKNVHKTNYLFGWMPRQAPLTKRTELGV